MDLQALAEECEKVQCPRFNDRQKRLQTLDWIRTRRVFEKIGFPDFDNKRTELGKYRPASKRRPIARYDVPSIVNRDVVSMLAGDGRFPIVTFGDPNEKPPAPDADGNPTPTKGQNDTKAFADVVRVVGLPAIMGRAQLLAGIGSVAIVPEVITPQGDGAPWLSFAMWRAYEVDPVFRRDRPDVLDKITRTWLISRAQLATDGYDLKELDASAQAQLDSYTKKHGAGSEKPPEFKWWYRRTTLDDNATTGYLPVPKELFERKDFEEWIVDKTRTAVHGLGFCPVWWHITWEDEDARPDGACIFEAAIDDALLIDRVLSVAANAVIAAGTPMLAQSTGAGSSATEAELLGDGEGQAPASPTGNEIDPDSVIEVAEKGGAWLVQMDGGAMAPLDVVITRLRAIALENVGGSRLNEDTLAGAKSGYAMELLNQALTYVAGQCRPRFESTVIGLVRMIARMRAKFEGLACEGGEVPEFDADANVKAVSYGPNYELSGQDKQFEVAAIVAAVGASLISTETAVAQVAQLFDVTDIETEVAKVKVQQQKTADDQHQKALELKTAGPPATGGPP